MLCGTSTTASSTEDAITPREGEFLAGEIASIPAGTTPAAWIDRVRGSWQEGIRFVYGGGDQNPLRTAWNGDRIREGIGNVVGYDGGLPSEFKHREDPLNAGQRFYGVNYLSFVDPLVLTREEVSTDDPSQWFLPAPPRPAPPAPDSDEFRASLLDVKDKGRLRELSPGELPTEQVIELTEDQIERGLFWAHDGARRIGTPPRLYNQIIRKVAVGDGFEDVRLAHLLALANVAMSDAGHAVWEAKYRHKYLRPVIWIREGPEDLRDPLWRPIGLLRTSTLDVSPESVILPGPATPAQFLSLAGAGLLKAPGGRLLAADAAEFSGLEELKLFAPRAAEPPSLPVDIEVPDSSLPRLDVQSLVLGRPCQVIC